MSGSDGSAGMTGTPAKKASLPRLLLPRLSAGEPRNLILCDVRADQGQSQSPKASVWNEIYVCLRNKSEECCSQRLEDKSNVHKCAPAR